MSRFVETLRTLAVDFEALRAEVLAPVSVAVIDSGIDASHPGLTSRVASAHASEGRGADVGVRTVDVPSNNDSFGHGTGVASVIAAIAPNAVIHDYRVLSKCGLGSADALLSGFAHALAAGHRVINLSLASRPRYASELHALCERAYRNNQIVVASERNAPLHDHGFPAELSSSVSVSMHRSAVWSRIEFRAGHPIEFAGRGFEVNVAAPGGGYTDATGTSFATPTVSGLICLLLGADPSLELFEVKTLLKASAIVEASGERAP